MEAEVHLFMLLCTPIHLAYLLGFNGQDCPLNPSVMGYSLPSPFVFFRNYPGDEDGDAADSERKWLVSEAYLFISGMLL